MKQIYIGLEGVGKDLHFAKLIKKVVIRNSKWKDKHGFVRPIATSQPLSLKFSTWIEKQGIPIIRVSTQRDIAKLIGCDLFIPELAVFFDARSWESMPFSLRVWLSQQSKRGVHFYGASQNWEQIDVSFRRLVPKGQLFQITKLLGSKRPGQNLPVINKVWGVYLIWDVEVDIDNNIKKTFFPPPAFHFIEKEYTSLFDTNKLTEVEYPPYEHFERTCEDKNCKHIKIIHR